MKEDIPPPNSLTQTRNLQLAAIVKEVESSNEPVILSVSFVIDLFDDVGFERWLGLYDYTADLISHPKAGADKTDRSYYHISKAPKIQDDGEDEEL